MMTKFGRERLKDWLLDPSITHLNHGTVGATPRRVLARQQSLRDEIERNPSQLLLRELSAAINIRPGGRERLREAADVVGAFLGARGADLGFVLNATHGVHAVLRSMTFAPGDEILVLEHAYGAVLYAADAVAKASGAKLVFVDVPFPLPSRAAIVDAVRAAITDRTRLAIIDHVTSSSALLLPVEEIVRALHARGVAVLVDGAHAPGAIAVDLGRIDADFYVGNLHKWAWAPRSCGVLWARADRQASLRGPVVSWGTGRGIAAELDWQGTLDPTPPLSAPEALAMMRELGVDDVRASNHALAWRAGNALADALGTRVGAPEDAVGTMIAVELPQRLGGTAEDAARVRGRLFDEHRIEVHMSALHGSLWARISAQIYVDDDDVMRLAHAVRAL